MRRYVFIIMLLLLIAGCNLTTTGGNPLTPTSPGIVPTVSYTPPTPYRAPDLNATPGAYTPPQGAGAQAVGAQAAQAAATTVSSILTPVPAQTLIANPQPSPNSQNAIEAFVNNLIIPAWNFVYTFFLEGLGTLWVFAGARGGAFAQVTCCIGPAVLLLVAVAYRLRIIRWWRR